MLGFSPIIKFKMWLKPLFKTYFFHGLKPVATENQSANLNLNSFLFIVMYRNNLEKLPLKVYGLIG